MLEAWQDDLFGGARIGSALQNKEHGYHRRDEELADAEEALSDWSERG